eukprot:111758-Chlamydomonas_euryale.AAC.15
MAHAHAEELAEDMRERRKRSVASIIGRAQLTPEQADRLMAGTAASRILDMLLTLPSGPERLALLPDCFTPPEVSAPPGGADDGADNEELWCTPAQLLSELEARIAAVNGATKGVPARAVGRTKAAAPLQLRSLSGQLTGQELLDAMQGLRASIKESWLEAMVLRESRS